MAVTWFLGVVCLYVVWCAVVGITLGGFEYGELVEPECRGVLPCYPYPPNGASFDD